MYVVATDNSAISEIKPSRRIFTAPRWGSNNWPSGYRAVRRVPLAQKCVLDWDCFVGWCRESFFIKIPEYCISVLLS